MAWDDRIFRYCERGQDASFWAEPFNAISNAAFLIAALLAVRELMRRERGARGSAEAGLIAVVFAIGIGSFLFHTFATRWASYADTGPIGLFMIAYLGYALRRFLGLYWLLVALAIAGFVWSLQVAGGVACRPALLPITAAANAPCLNGTAGYVPAWLVMVLLAIVLAAMRHPAWRLLGAASVALLVSMTLRTLDLEWCGLTQIAGRARGTHALWHLLNATALYLLLLAAIRHGRSEN